MGADLLKAHLNLGAVLQNLEDLPGLDPEAAAICGDWNISVQFTVMGGPSAWLEYKGGSCRHGAGAHAAPDVRLGFVSPAHLNRMFDGRGMPVPLKGFGRLGFLKNDFPKITARLEHYLKPGPQAKRDEAFVRARTTLLLHTAAHAVRELARLEPVCRKVAAGTPHGTLQISLSPEGPHAWVKYGPQGVEAGKGAAEHPSARMIFRDINAAAVLLNNQVDGFTAIGRGDLAISGLIPLVDNTSLIMDRVEKYLS